MSTTLNNRVHRVAQAIAEMKYAKQTAKISAINDFNASESVDGYSVTFATPLTSEQRKKLFDIIKTYLSDCVLQDGTPYLYCGADK